MENRQENQEFLCRGPVDLVQICKRNSTMRLLLKEADGTRTEAVYRGCFYCRLGQREKGIRLMQIRRVSARELLENPDSVSVLALHKRGEPVVQMLHDWENAGLAFYLHQGSAACMEFLVVCQSVEWQRIE